ncbi:MAG: hypothetical protein WD182_08540, partial [Bacteroidota bacterium]
MKSVRRFMGTMMVLAWFVTPGYGQQRTWHVNNVTGSDSFNGLSESVGEGTAGPKRTLTATLSLTTDGDVIAIASTGMSYGPSSGESPIVEIVNKRVTLRALRGMVEIRSGMDVNLFSGAAPQQVTLEGVGFRLSGGLWLTAGELLSLAANLELGGSVTRTRGRLIGRPSFIGPLDFFYNAQQALTLGDEFPPPGDSLSCRSLVLNGLFPLIATYSLTINGMLVVRTPLDLGGSTLRLRPGRGFSQHLVRAAIGNGTVECIVADSLSFDAAVTSLPHVVIKSHPETPAAHVVLRASSMRSLSVDGPLDVTVVLSGLTSFASPDIAGPIIHHGSGEVIIDRSVRSVLYIGGTVQLLGSGKLQFPAVGSSGIVINGDVQVATSIELKQQEVLRNRSRVWFGDALTTITGTVRNMTSIRGGSTASGCDSTGLIVFEASNSGISLGGISNEVIVSAPSLAPGNRVRNSGNILFRFQGDQSGSFVVGGLSNDSRVEAGHDGSGLETPIGSILFTNVIQGVVEIGSLVNRSEVVPWTSQAVGGAILFASGSGGEIAVGSMLAAGDRGGEIRLGGKVITVQKDVTNSRSGGGGSIVLMLTGDEQRLVVGGAVEVLGGSDVSIVSSGNPRTRIEGDLRCLGTGTIRWSSKGANVLQVQGSLVQRAGLLEFRRENELMDGGTEKGDTVRVRGDLRIEGGTIDGGVVPRHIILNGRENVFGALQAVPMIRGDRTTFQIEGGTNGSDLQRLELVGGEIVFPADLIVTSRRGSSAAAILRGTRSTVRGSVRFGDAGTDLTVRLDGLRLKVEGPQGILNESGYRTENGGLLVLMGGSQTLAGRGAFADVEIASTGTISVTERAGPFNGRFILTSGFVQGSGNLIFSNPTSPPLIIRREGSFDEAPQFASPVNLHYAGLSKISSFELPRDSTTLNDLFIQAPENVAGVRSVVQLANPVTVHGTFRVEPGQVLALRRSVNLVMKGAHIVNDGDIVSSHEEAGSLVLASSSGVTIAGAGYLPTLSVLTDGSAHTVRGARSLVNGLYGDDLTIGTNDDVDLLTAHANGDLLIHGQGNQILLEFGAGMGPQHSHIRNLWLQSADNTVALSSNLTISGSWKSLGSFFQVGGADLSITGPEIALRGTNVSGTTGRIRFIPPASISVGLRDSDNLSGIPVRLRTETPVMWKQGEILLLEGHTAHPILRDGVYRISSVVADNVFTLEDLEGTVVTGDGGATGGSGRATSVQVVSLFSMGSRVTDLVVPLEVVGVDSTSRFVLGGSGGSVPMSLPHAFLAQSVRIFLGWPGKPNDLILRADSVVFGRNVVFDRSGGGSLIMDSERPSRLVSADTVRFWNLQLRSDVTVAGSGSWLEVGGLFRQEAGMNLQHSTMVIKGAYSHLNGSISSITGKLVLQGAVVTVGPSGLMAPSVIMEGTPSSLEGSGVLTVMKRFELNTEGGVIVGPAGAPVLAFERGLEMIYRKGSFSQPPGFAGTIRLVVAPGSSTGIPSSVWPMEPQNLVSHFTVQGANRSQTIRLPGERYVVSLLDLQRGTLDLTNPGERLILHAGATIRRTDDAMIQVSTQLDQNLTIGDSTAVEYYRTATDSLLAGPELTQRVRTLVFTREGNRVNSPTVLSRSVFVLDSLVVANDVIGRPGVTISVGGSVIMEWDHEGTAATEPVFRVEEPLRFVGPKNQSIVVPARGASIGSLHLEKENGTGSVSLIGGSLFLKENAVLVLSVGLLFTGDHTLYLDNPILPVLGTDQGFLRFANAGLKSHVVGTVRKRLKIGNSSLRAQTVFPVGDPDHYRPLTLTFVRPSLSDPVIHMQASASVSHRSERPSGTVG